MAGVGKSLVGQAAGKGAVADYRGHPIRPAQDLLPCENSQGRGNRSGSVARVKGVMGTFGALGKTREPSGPAEGGKPLIPAGQKLMSITLMPHIPDNLILGRIKNPVQGDSQLHYPQIGSQMSTVLVHRAYDKFPNFRPQAPQLGKPQIPEIPGPLQRSQEGLIFSHKSNITFFGMIVRMEYAD